MRLSRPIDKPEKVDRIVDEIDELIETAARQIEELRQVGNDAE